MELLKTPLPKEKDIIATVLTFDRDKRITLKVTET